MFTDNKTIAKEIYKTISKESNAINGVGVIVAAIREEINNASIDISVEYANNKPKPDKTFQQQLGNILMKKCDEASKAKRQILDQSNIIRNITQYSIATLCRKNVILDKNINTLI